MTKTLPCGCSARHIAGVPLVLCPMHAMAQGAKKLLIGA